MCSKTSISSGTPVRQFFKGFTRSLAPAGGEAHRDRRDDTRKPDSDNG
jgi:hypothetical protein